MNNSHDPKLVHITAAGGSAVQQHGGTRRSNQLRADLRANYEFTLPPISKVSLLSFFRYLAHWKEVPRGLTIRGFVKALISIGLLIDFLKTTEGDWRKHHFAIEVARGPILYIGYALAKLGVRYIALPHNIEFLVPNQINNEAPRGAHQHIEAEIYRQASRIFTISALDKFIIHTMVPNADVVTHPYYPSPTDQNRFRAIANRRREKNSRTAKLVYVGTVKNPPTKVGLMHLLEQFSELQNFKFQLHIAGFGTETIGNPPYKHIKIHGSLPDDALDELLIEAIAAVIVQPPTTGFLTRITELNLSGIPIFVNSEYLPARGLERFGIFSFSDVNELLEKLSRMDTSQIFDMFHAGEAIFVG